MTTLTKAEYLRGVVEHETRFVVRCTRCERSETRGALPNVLDLDPDTSPPAKRMRSTCRARAPLPCTFTIKPEVVALTHAQALDAGRCASTPLVRLQGDDGEVAMASRLNLPATLVELVAINEMAQRAYEALAEEG